MIIACSLMLSVSDASAFDQRRGNDGWKQKMMSEKIAFLTTEMELTPKESQKFWPVYNEVNKEKDEAMHEVFKTYMELSQAVEGGASDNEIEKKLNNYLDALKAQRKADNMADEKFLKVLPMEKVAKLYVAEEKFRRWQIHRLHQANR